MSETGIYFPQKPDKKLAIRGSTGFSGLSMLLTLNETARLVQAGSDVRFIYQTDRAGLHHAVYAGSLAADAIADALEVIGKLAVYADHEELDAGDRMSLGWLITGLGELSKDVAIASHGVAIALAEGRHLQNHDGDAAYGK